MKIMESLSINQKREMNMTGIRKKHLIFICLGLWLLCIAAHAQSDSKITFDFKNYFLKDAIELMINKYEVPIVYQKNQMKEIHITAKCNQCDTKTALDKLLKETPFKWDQVGTQYILSLKKVKKPIGKSSITGFLRDTSTGEPLSFANVLLKNTQLGAASDVHGYYVINSIVPGNHTLIVSMMGYEKIEKEIFLQPKEQKRLDFELATQAIIGEEVVVTAERTRFNEAVEVSRTSIGMREINSTPSFIEADVFRTIQQLPTVTSQNDFSSALVVRGGSPDENLILLDGAEIYNPYHLAGLFSTFNTDAISDADFMAGGYPADHTGRLSSVLDITSRDGNSRQGKFFNDSKFGEYWDLSRVKGEVSLLSSRGLAEGPFYKGAWILSGRRTYFDLMADIAQKGKDWDYFFWDNQFKIFSDLNPKNRITFSTFNGRDVLKFKFNEVDFESKIDFDWDWGNNSSSLQWRYIPSSKFLSEFTVTRSKFDFDLALQYTEVDSLTGRESKFKFNVFNKIHDITFNEKLSWFASPRHTLTLGASYKKPTIQFDFELNRINFFNLKEKPSVFSVFVQDKWKVTDLLTFQYGLRSSKYKPHDKIYLDPRIGFKYMLNENLSLKGNWGMFNQFLFTTNDENAILRIVDFWQAIPKKFDAIQNQHFITGIEKWFDQGFTGSVEAYYKPYSNILTNNPNNDPAIQDDEFISGKGHAWGVELLLKKSTGRLTGWIGYSFSNIERRFDYNGDGKIQEIDNEMSEIFTPIHSKPHSLNLVTSYQINPKNQISLSLTISSGQPYTPVIGKVYHGGDDLADPYSDLINIQGRRNSSRYPLYIRGDIAWKRKISLWGAPGTFSLNIMNFTNHFNVLTYIWDHSESPSKVKAIGMFPIFPSLGLEFEL